MMFDFINRHSRRSQHAYGINRRAGAPFAGRYFLGNNQLARALPAFLAFSFSSPLVRKWPARPPTIRPTKRQNSVGA